jgi:predicted MPP superfamily phosphohydrolase
MGRPSVERTSLAVAGLPAGSPPIRIALISDIHMAGPDMSPEQVAEIVAQVNALGPDLVAIAGDLLSDKRTATHTYTPEEIVAPLGKLKSRLGTFVVPGNHDHWFDMQGLFRELQANGITLLANEAIQAGPLVIGGLDDAYTHRADVRAKLAAMGGLSSARIMLSHSPDPFPRMPSSVSLMLAGLTHCGQIAYP